MSGAIWWRPASGPCALAKNLGDNRYVTFFDMLPALREAANRLLGRLRLSSAQLPATAWVKLFKSLIAAIQEDPGELLF